ncbi:tRNA (N(6)-L-threonylcarbamoyladenosine(37)-C(2))-methylthiotransferase MtaB [Novosphingobium sediminis]|uniref:tRNA (N(6)-L-threonylcarbamoyladenosine(37)-C(2) )-methylthiotransferase MtaB n=1 Tax=Novosphingobium sediminis TaxID=707214 RepID=A0A512ANS6_9SPHN|nr:MiaB/RimO family radical SAM methylthiotransferase [Novosphingobium sediminis]GEO01362.1 tRNA (N(6)-L-threonylcarbamoyladenosine(37)-C(2))-methylthiotransferase MtaB [Novosphingobium sediminis]
MSDSVVTLGCRLNLAESEAIRSLIDGAAQRTVVVNSCAVTAEAVRQSRRAVRRLRAANPDARLLVTGCAATITPDDFTQMPEVDGVVANAVKLDAAAWQARPALITPAPPTASRHTRAFVPVQTGCDHACTFCIIPEGRGKSVSQPIGAVLRVVESHLAAGAREVVLTGVDVTGWGADLPDGQRLGDLVAAILAEFPALPRLRLSSLDGVEIDELLFELITGEARVMPHVHLSLQAGHDLTLKRMKRRHTREEAVALSERLRSARPDIAIGADLIAGFPTEDEAMHAANVAIVEDCGIVHGHVFPYSPRPGTPAARMPQVPPPLVRERAAEVRAAVAATRARWLESLVGVPREVLAERDGTGHSPEFAPYRLPDGTAPGTLLTLTPTRIREGLLE